MKNFYLTSLVSVGIFLCRNSNKKPEFSAVAKHAPNQHSEPPLGLHGWLNRTKTCIQVSAKKQHIHHCRRLAHLQLHLWPWAWSIYLSSDSATSRPTFGKQPAGKHRRTLLARGLDLPWMAGSTAGLLSRLCRIWKLHSFWQSPVPKLALGHELCNRPFLWVVRPDITTGANDAYPEGFQERVSTRGLMVGWAPQQKVLSHPSVACFLSHWGWNSVLEGVSNGVPFLCWPYFADQIFNQGYICDVWRVGLGLNPDERGVILREEIKNKVDELLIDEKFKARAMELKEMTALNVKEGGKSHSNLKNFIEWIKS